jgi:hypothetical protein
MRLEIATNFHDQWVILGDCYAGICGSPGLKCPGPPDLRRLGWSETTSVEGAHRHQVDPGRRFAQSGQIQ